MKNSGKPILERIMQYCADAERCTHDVLTKLVSWGLPMEETEIILTKLKAEKFLDDHRYTTSYVKEKWNLGQWGKIKIENALQLKNIDPVMTQQALTNIAQEEYTEVLHDLLSKKQKEVTTSNKSDEARRILMFALSCGFEEELIYKWLEERGYEIEL
ncbi:MAG: regulatory protein RecX [Saprospiraceae bacterium]